MAEDRTVQLRAPSGVNRFSTITGETLNIGSDGTVWLTEVDARSARQAGFTDAA